MIGSDELLLLRALLRASDTGVLLSDAARHDLVCNRRFCELFGVPEDAVPAPPERMRALVLPRLKAPEEFMRVLDAVYADPYLIREDEIELTAPRPRRLRRYTAPVVNEDGELIGRLWTFLDVTQTRALEQKVQAQAGQLRVQARQLAASLKTVSGRLHRMESTLTQTQQQLFESEKLSAVGLLAASVAHDIRNILTPVSIEISLADQDDPAGRALALHALRGQVDRLSLLTRRLLSLARPPAPQRIALNFGELLAEIASLLRPQAAMDGVEIVLPPSIPIQRLPRVCGDPAQIEQVLVNLSLNGVQAMASTGGTLTLSMQRASLSGREGVRLHVRDTGPGIAPGIRAHLFDPFVSTKPDGAGLGLFSCRRIVEEHGGDMRVRSGAGGTEVSVWLPADMGAAESEKTDGGQNPLGRR